MSDHHDPHAGLHSEQGGLSGEHPGRAKNPVVKVHDLAWLEFEKPNLDRAEAFAHAFGFSTALRTPDALQLRGTDPGAPCVLIRQGRSRFVGPAFRAADSADVLRLAEATGATATKLPESMGGLSVELTDPTGLAVRVVSDTDDLAALPGQEPLELNFGHASPRANSTQRAPREPAKVQRLGHVVLQTTKYLESLNWYLQHLGPDRQRLPVLPGAARTRAGNELSPLRPRCHPDRPPHAGDDAGPQPLRPLRLPGRRPRRAGRRRGVPARPRLPALRQSDWP